MRLPFISRRQHDAEIAELKRRVLATEARHDQVEDKRRRLAGWLAESEGKRRTLTEELAATTIVNACLTENLAAAREELAELRAQSSDTAAAHWKAEAKREKKRADQLQKQYDDACGLNSQRGDVGLYGSEHWKPPISLDTKPGVTS